MDTIKPYTAADDGTLGELLSCYAHVVKCSPLWLDGAISADLRKPMPDPVATARAIFDAIEARLQAEHEALFRPTRRKPTKPTVTPAWLETTRRPERERPPLYHMLQLAFFTSPKARGRKSAA